MWQVRALLPINIYNSLQYSHHVRYTRANDISLHSIELSSRMEIYIGSIRFGRALFMVTLDSLVTFRVYLYDAIRDTITLFG